MSGIASTKQQETNEMQRLEMGKLPEPGAPCPYVPEKLVDRKYLGDGTLSIHSRNESFDTVSEDRSLGKPRVVLLPSEPRPTSFATIEQAWEGCVDEFNGNTILASLLDLTGGNPEEAVEIPVEEVAEDDRSLIARGALFYWYIYYHTSESGQIRRSSMIRFRRLPQWTETELQKAEEEAAKLLNFLSRNDDTHHPFEGHPS